MSLKTAIFGYSKKSVDAKLGALLRDVQDKDAALAEAKAKMESTEARLALLQEELAAQHSEKERSEYMLKYRLDDFTRRYEEATAELRQKNSQLEHLAQIYYYAFANAGEIAKSAYAHSEKMVKGVEEAAETARQQAAQAQQQMFAHRDGLSARLKAIRETADAMEGEIATLSGQLEGMFAVPQSGAAQQLEQEYQRLLADFEANTKGLLAHTVKEAPPQAPAPASQPAPPRPERAVKETPPIKEELPLGASLLEEQKKELSAQLIRETVEKVLGQTQGAPKGEAPKRPDVRELLKKYSQI